MKNIPDKIIGAGGGGGRQPDPTIDDDTLNSRQFGTFLELISEGEIEGFATASKEGRTRGTTAYNNAAKKDIFFNDTPILRPNADSANPRNVDFNFRKVRFVPRFGTSNQTKIKGIVNNSSSTPVGVPVRKANPVTREIPNRLPNAANPDAVRVTITVPQLQEATTKGDLLGRTIRLKISVSFNNGAFEEKVDDKITGRTADTYQKDYRINLNGTFPVRVRVTRVTKDSTTSSIQDAFEWTTITEVFDKTDTFPDCAYCSLRVDSMEFGSVPTRKYRIRGIKVRIPGAGALNSGTPTVDSNGRIVYPDGYIFNGVMQQAKWTTCPAMILLDLLTEQRYGFGVHISPNFDPSNPSDTDLYENIDLFTYVTASKYSNQLVNNEARFACNVNITSSNGAFELINELAGVMRCMPIWSAGSIQLAQDSPKDASYLFTLANVTEEGFSYQGSSLKTRHTVISVGFFNMRSREIDFEEVRDQDAIDKFGIITKQIKAFGCTSRKQARRMGRAVLFAEQHESEVVTFSTSIDSGVVVRPGQVIDVADPVRSGVRVGGRVKSATIKTITVDDTSETTLSDDNNPFVSVILPDGTAERKQVAQIDLGVITINGVFSDIPNSNSVWLLENDSVLPQKFRVITVEENDGASFTITALSYVPDKYNFIDKAEEIEERDITTLNDPVDPPTSLVAEEKIVAINNNAVSKLIISWQPVAGVTQYQVNYRFNDGNFVSTTVSAPDFEIFNTSIGTYEIQIFSYNSSLQLSPTSSDLVFNAEGKTARPQNVTGLTIEPFSEKLIRLRWNVAQDIDVTHGGFVYVRHSTLTDGSGTFANAVDLVDALPGNSTQAVVPFLEGEYILKFQDDGGRFSKGETSIVIDLPDNTSQLTALTRREDLLAQKFCSINNSGSCTAVKTNVNFDAPSNSLMLTNPARLTGTYVQSNGSDNSVAGTVVTCAVNTHGLTVGQVIQLEYLTGDSIDGEFAVASVVDANNFTITASDTLVTSGDVVVKRNMKGSYEFAQTLDLGGIFSLDLKRHFLTEGFYIGTLFDDRTALIDTWEDFDGAEATSVNSKILVAVSQDMSSYTGFNEFANGTFKGRGFKFKAELETDDPAQNIKISQLGFTASLVRRTEQSNVLTANGSTNVTFTNTFFTGATGLDAGQNSNPPSIGITALNLNAGEFFQVSSIDGSGFTIVFKDSGGNAINGKEFTFQAVGFGKG